MSCGELCLMFLNCFSTTLVTYTRVVPCSQYQVNRFSYDKICIVLKYATIVITNTARCLRIIQNYVRSIISI